MQAGFLMALVLKATIVMAASWALTRAMTRAAAAARSSVWASGIAFVVALPVLMTIVPGWSLGQTGRGAAALARAPLDDDRAVRNAAAIRLDSVHAPIAVPNWITLLEDADPMLRERAAISLGVIGDPRAIESLAHALADRETAVRYQAAKALAAIAVGPPEARNKIEAVANQDRPVYRAGDAGVTLPEPVKQVRPEYTQAALTARIQGQVLLEAIVEPDGSIMKSADWAGNRPFPLKARTAEEWAKMPRYYIMDLDKGMAETVAAEMPSAAAIAANRWLPDRDLRVHSDEYGRTGFQGGLQGYRGGGRYASETQLFAGRTLDQPSVFIAGRSDWGAYQNPGALERMQKVACTRMRGVHFVDGAGHWVQQEQPQQVIRLLLDFLAAIKN